MTEIAIPDQYVHLPDWVDPKPFRPIKTMYRHVITAMANKYHGLDKVYFSTDDIKRLLFPLLEIEGYGRFLWEEIEERGWGMREVRDLLGKRPVWTIYTASVMGMFPYDQMHDHGLTGELCNLPWDSKMSLGFAALSIERVLKQREKPPMYDVKNKRAIDLPEEYAVMHLLLKPAKAEYPLVLPAEERRMQIRHTF